MKKRRLIAMASALAALLAPPALRAVPYNATAANVDPGGAGYQAGDLALGDYNNDARLDVVVSGRSANGAGNRQLRLYVNNGAGFNAAVNVGAAAGTGFQDGGVTWADLDNDGFLDIVANGLDAAGARQLRAYYNVNAGGTFTAVNIPGAAGAGMNLGRVGTADFDNDGDPDVLACGTTTGANAGGVLRVYPNRGNRTFGTAVAVDAAGFTNCDVAAGDFNNDGRMDVLTEGLDTGGVRRLRAYRNTTANGIISFAAAVTVDATGLAQGGVAWGDFNNDGFLDVLASGSSTGANGGAQLRVYLNNGAGGFGAAVNVPGAANAGMWRGSAAVGDTDNDGDLDILVSGQDNTGTRQLRVYRNNGAAVFNAVAVTDVAGAGGGLRDGGVAWGDMGTDRKNEVVVSGVDAGGARWLRVYTNTTAQADVVPTAPTALASSFTFTTAGVSTATFKWNPGTDTAPGATSANMLTYDLQVSTTAAFTGTYTIPGQRNAGPLLGNYLRAPLIYDGNTRHGVVLLSTSPSAAGAAPQGLRTDTTYYFRVRTYDLGLTASPFTAASSLWTGVEPSSVTNLLAGSGPVADQVTISWSSPGDDASLSNLTGNYRIQYSTSATIAWSTGTTPMGAFTVMIATANAIPGSLRSNIIGGLTNGTLYYFRLWSQDDVGLWSSISNQASAVADTGGGIAPGRITSLGAVTGPAAGQIALSWVAPGEDNYVAGTFASGYDIRWSTVAANSPANSDALFNAAPSVSPSFGTIPAPLVQGSSQTMLLAGLQQSVTYYFAIKAYDDTLNYSVLSNGATTWAQIDFTAPGRITDLLAVPSFGPGAIDLTWTAVGDDGYTAGGSAQTYDIRYSSVAANSPAVSDANFNAAPSVSGLVALPAPDLQGSAESLTIPGLTQAVTYYFAIKARDETPNTSALSNGATTYAQIITRSVTIDLSEYLFGTVPLGLTAQTTADFTITYDGNDDSTFRLYAATATVGSPWSLGATPGANRLRLYAAFNSVMPASTDFTAADILTTAPQACTVGGLFSLDQDCVGVVDGEVLSLWFRLDMPTTTAVAAEQRVQVTVEAGPP